MTMLQKAFGGIADLWFKQNQTRPMPMGTNTSSPFGISANSGGSQPLQQLQAMSGSGWLFAVINRISSGVAAVDWHLYRKQSGNRRLLLDATHPAMQVWQEINPFYTNSEFVTLSVQNYLLTGESWWVKVRDGRGRTIELWPVRPDHMKVIPSREEYISGYIYKLGNEQVPLDIDDVVFIRYPNSIDPFRGTGVVQAILTEIQTDRNASAFTSNFFSNGAQPGGIIEVEEGMSDMEFERFREHWRAQHQGVANAHRVAIIEKGHWVDRKVSHRDMQFEQLRKLNRDIIIGAFGIHAAIMGVTENVNRANANAAESHFARWNLTPLLTALRDGLNKGVAIDFGTDLAFDFEDPTPDDVELKLSVATSAYTAGIITRNEAREQLGLDIADIGGDTYATASELTAPVETNSILSQSVSKWAVNKQEEPEVIPTNLSDIQELMYKGWEKRLTAELASVIAVLSRSEKQFKVVGLEDIEAHDWNWWAKYGDEVTDELRVAFSFALLDAMPELALTQLQQLSIAYAARHGAELLRVDGEANLAKYTRARVRVLTARAIEEGQSLNQLSKTLREDVAFSPSRAEMISRTESATALGQGHKQIAVNEGRDEKKWMTQGDHLVTDLCRQNAMMGWIPVSSNFDSGKETIPEHPRCRCNVIYRTKALHLDAISTSVAVFYCTTTDCGKLLAKDTVSGASYYCRTCKETSIVK